MAGRGRSSRSRSRKRATSNVPIEQTENLDELDEAFQRMKFSKNHRGREWNTRMPRNALVVYTDGSALRDRSGFGIYAGPNHDLNRSQRINHPPHKPQRAEVLAVLQALRNILNWDDYNDETVIIRTDALFIIQAINGEARLSNFENELLEILALAVRIEGGVQFQHVYAHGGDPGNEAADDLARQATVGPRRSRSKSRDRNMEHGRERSRENNRQHIASHSAVVRRSNSYY